METATGMNSVVRGDVAGAPNLKSGVAIATVINMAAQYSMGLVKSYNKMFEDVYTFMIDVLKDSLDKINRIINDKSKICKILNKTLKVMIKYNARVLHLESKIPTRQFEIKEIEETYGVSVGIDREKDVINIADWLFTSKLTRSTTYLLYFIIVKESLFHFIDFLPSEIDEAITNIVAILWLKNYFEINTLDNPMYKAIDHRIYSEEIAGLHYLQFVNFTCILFIKNKSLRKSLLNTIRLLEIIKKVMKNKLMKFQSGYLATYLRKISWLLFILKRGLYQH